jgi:hypothetical protein
MDCVCINPYDTLRGRRNELCFNDKANHQQLPYVFLTMQTWDLLSLDKDKAQYQVYPNHALTHA